MVDLSKDALFEELFDIVPFAVYIVDVQTYRIVYANSRMKIMSGEAELVGRTCYKNIFKNDSPCLHCRIDELVEEGRPNQNTAVFELFNETDDSWYQMHEKAITWSDGSTVKYALAVEINRLKMIQNNLAEAHAELAIKNKELQEFSVLDSLTSLYNRKKLDEVMAYELKRAARTRRPFSVVLIDIDDFKKVNDELGHLAGDNVLKDLALILKNNVREADLVFRWGGEEMLVFTPETGALGIRRLSEKLRKAVAGHSFECGKRITISLGAATYKPRDTHSDIIARADKALYRAKTQGKNRFNFL